MKTQAYPNFNEYMPSKPSYNLNKWLDTMRDMYVKMHLGADRKDAFEMLTNGWNQNERQDFSEWLKYYESGDVSKYKMAQNNSYYVNDDLNYFLPNPQKPPVPSPIRSINEQITQAPSDAEAMVKRRQEELDKETRRKIMEDQRRKILGRLNAAEKLLSSQEGQTFAGTDFEKLLTAIHELKRQIQTVNRISVSAQTIVDLIVRQANILNRGGFAAPAEFLIKFAQQTPGDFSVQLGTTPAGGSQPQGLGGLGNNTPNLPDNLAPPTETNNSPIDQFMKNMEDAGLTDLENDKLEADDIEMDKDVYMDQEIVPDDNLVVEAQVVPDAPAPELDTPTKPTAPKDEIEPDAPKTITPEEAKRAPQVAPSKSDFDSLIDSAFSNLTVQDVITKLEQINNIFRTREIARQLSICDLMLSRLGIAQFFPQLSEIINKNLDSNQYSLLRMDQILSTLRGSIKTPGVDLEGEKPSSPAGEAAKANLEQMENKEKQRKEVKKQLQEQTDIEKVMKPEGEVKPEGAVENPQADLTAQPLEVESPAPAPKPAALPAV